MKQAILNSWPENNQSNANYDVGNEIIYNKQVLKSNLCDHRDAYILVKCANQAALRDCPPFTKCIR